MSPSARRVVMTHQQFRDILKAAGITQAEAAAKLGKSKRQVSRWALGLTGISEANAAYINAQIKA